MHISIYDVLLHIPTNRSVNINGEMNNTKEDILQKAFVLFLKKSYKSVSIDDIQKETQLSRGAIYHHFKSKDEILGQVLDLFFFPSLSTLSSSEAPKTQHPLKTAIENSLKKRASFINDLRQINQDKVEDFYFFKLAFQADEFYPNFKQKVQILKQKEEQMWFKILQMASLAGEIKEKIDIENTAKLLMIIPDGMGINSSFDSGLPLESLRDLYTHLYTLIRT